MIAREFKIKKDLRTDERLPVSHRGTLNSGDAWFPCLIENMSERGLLVLSNRAFPVGQVLEFRCEFHPGKLFNCKLEVRHVDDTVVGTKVIEIDKREVSYYQLFLEEQYADRATVRSRH
jgi:hypothetical protein